MGGGLSLKSLPGGVDSVYLHELLQSTVPRGRVGKKTTTIEPTMIFALQTLLETWSSEIEGFLASNTSPHSEAMSSGAATVAGAPQRLPIAATAEPCGPQVILEDWKLRMRNNISVTEQLRRRDIRVSWGAIHSLCSRSLAADIRMSAIVARACRLSLQR
jgi:hypothetical protein